MAYELFQSGRSQFAVDWGVVRRLIRSYYTAYYQLRYAREVTLSDSHWYNPMSWSLPDVSHIEVDWEAVRRYTDGYTDFDVQDMQQRAKSGGAAPVAYQLENMIDTAAQNKEALIDWMGNVQTENMKSIERSVDEYQSKVEIAKFVRDSAADGLMVGASVMSGGAALAVMGGGSMLKGEAKWQDTGSIGAGIMEGTGSFVFAYVKLGKSFSFKQDMVLALVQTPYKAKTELVGGASLGKAGLSGALKLTGPSIDRLFKIGPAKTFFDKLAVPVVITYQGENVASKFLSKYTATIVQKRGIEGAGKNAILNIGSPSPSPPNSTADDRRQRQGQVIAEATLTSKYLLYLGFVNQENGIGRGWQ